MDDDDGDGAFTFSPRLQKLAISLMVTIIATAVWTALIPDLPAKSARSGAQNVSSLKQGAKRQSMEPVQERPPDMVFVLPPEPAALKPAKSSARLRPVQTSQRSIAKRTEPSVRHRRIRPNPY